MIDGWLLLAMGALAGLADFAVGLYLLRRSPAASPLYSEGMPLSASATARIGRLVMLTSPILLIVFALLAFGLVPVDAIEPISLN